MARAVVICLAASLVGCAFEGDRLDHSIDAQASTRCAVTETAVDCDFATVTFATGAFGLSAREVHFMLPVGEAPAGGWPTVLLFQGSLHPADGFFSGNEGDAYGGLHQARLVATLLERGYAVIAPDARYDGGFWDSNVAPFNVLWDTSEDHQLMVELLSAIDAGSLGPLDGSALFAAGISSGGYMTSRMAVSYPGRFRALAVQSAAYATCAGALCDVPALPDDHAPTLLLLGGQDLVVPPFTTRDYAAALEENGTETMTIEDDAAGHEWIARAPDAVADWFDARL